MREWSEPPDVKVPGSLRAMVGGHPLIAKTLVRRGITDVDDAKAFLDPRHYKPAPPTELPGMSRAAERLEHAIELGEAICVWGDFDVDGQTATTTLVSTIRDLKGSVRFHIPNRQREGHGIKLPVLKHVIDEGVDVLLTCDTGVTAEAPVAYAQERGVDVIITDHHDLPPRLPKALAVVDPKMLPATHPLRELPGVGVAYKLAELLYDRAGRRRESRRYLDLVALGIVADVATQTGDVRYLLQLGLEALRGTERLGLQTLIEVCGFSPEWLTEEHIGFELAPRLNALGRLADATPAVEFLTTDDMERARILAHELDGLNARRKMICDEVTKAAERQIERDPSLLEQGALVLSHPSWPGGVIGIVAGRLAERYHRPTILIAAPPDQLARGSARSVEDCDISAAIAANGELLESSGGHPMAAGLSIAPERIPEFRRAISQTVRDMCAGALASEDILEIDGYVPLADLSLDLVEETERLAPFGSGNPPLTLATRGLSLKNHTTVGRSGEHLKLTVEDEKGKTEQVLWWQAEASDLPEGPFDLAYTVRATDYRGQRHLQIEWIDARPIREPDVDRPLERPSVKVVDHRRVSDLRSALASLLAQPEVLVWSEGEDAVPGRDRYRLEPSTSLAIWTSPPGSSELRAALARVSPSVVHLFAVDPGLDDPRIFLTRLAQLAKEAMVKDGGAIELRTLAAATAHREETIRSGLAWLEAQGHLTVIEEAGGVVRLRRDSESTAHDRPEMAERLRALLQETRAYRGYVVRADAEALINNALSP
ncbi:MAG: single-stranded-DNA-specific exonuclease RecJ [Anaerolineae bacterium]|jgi:single-stranded-DNA-specific exonuclease